MRVSGCFRAAACAALALAACVSSAAVVHPDPIPGAIWRKTGTIKLGVDSPALARTVYVEGGEAANGAVGYVFALPSTADGKKYTLVRDGGVVEDNVPPLPPPPSPLPSVSVNERLDVYFYETIAPTAGWLNGKVCPIDRTEGDPTETGWICPGPYVANWAVVVLQRGAMSAFDFSYRIV